MPAKAGHPAGLAVTIDFRLRGNDGGVANNRAYRVRFAGCDSV